MTVLGAAPFKSWLPTYIALGMVWGASFLFIEQSLTFLTPVGVAFLRCFLGALSLWAVVLLKKIAIIRNPLMLFHLWIVGLLLNVFPGVLFAFAQERVSSILAGIMNALTPIMSVLMILLIFRNEKLTANRILGIALGFLGVLIVLLVGESIGRISLSALTALVLAVLCYGISFPYLSKFIILRKLPSESLATTQVSLAALTLLPFFIYRGVNSYQPSLEAVGSILGLGILGTGIAYIWNFKNVELAGASLASTVTYITPLVAVVLGFLLLGEPLTWNEPVGALIVLIGSAIAQGRIRVFKS
ncbi:MAG: DMT family transporter [Actinomycetota bacterium]